MTKNFEFHSLKDLTTLTIADLKSILTQLEILTTIPKKTKPFLTQKLWAWCQQNNKYSFVVQIRNNIKNNKEFTEDKKK